MYRLTIRATDESVPEALLKLMVAKLELGVSTSPEKPEQLSRRDISDAFSSVLVN